MKYWVFQDDRVNGPYEPDELARLPGYSAQTLVFPAERNGGEPRDWRRVRGVAELSASLIKAAPTSPDAEAPSGDIINSGHPPEPSPAAPIPAGDKLEPLAPSPAPSPTPAETPAESAQPAPFKALAAPEAAAPGLSRRRTVLALAGLSLALVAGALLLRRATREPPLTAFPVERRDLAVSVKATGKVEPKNLIPVRAPVLGRVEKIHFQRGDLVKKGDILATMSSADRAAILDKALSESPDAYNRWKGFYLPTPVVAPVGGKIINRMVLEGEMAQGGQPVFMLADELILRAGVDEADIARIQVGQKAVAVADAYPDTPFPARVAAVGLQATSPGGVTLYEVELTPSGIPADLKTGMSVEVAFVVQERQGALTIPLAAVKGRERAEVRLLVRGPRTAPSLRTIRLGISDGKYVELVSGVSQGEAVLVETPGFMRQAPAGPPGRGAGMPESPERTPSR